MLSVTFFIYFKFCFCKDNAFCLIRNSVLLIYFFTMPSYNKILFWQIICPCFSIEGIVKNLSEFVYHTFSTNELIYIVFLYHICNHFFLLCAIYYISYRREFVLKFFFLHLQFLLEKNSRCLCLEIDLSHQSCMMNLDILSFHCLSSNLFSSIAKFHEYQYNYLKVHYTNS